MSSLLIVPWLLPWIQSIQINRWDPKYYRTLLSCPLHFCTSFWLSSWSPTHQVLKSRLHFHNRILDTQFQPWACWDRRLSWGPMFIFWQLIWVNYAWVGNHLFFCLCSQHLWVRKIGIWRKERFRLNWKETSCFCIVCRSKCRKYK